MLPSPTRPTPPDFAAYLDKVRTRAYTVTDADVEALKAAGHSEDEIFEQTVSAAVAAGLLRLRGRAAGDAAMRLEVRRFRPRPAEAAILAQIAQARGVPSRLGRPEDALLPAGALRPAVLGGAGRGDARTVRLVGGRARAVRRLRLVAQPVPVLNALSRRGRVVRAR